jgi:hopanoid biosynthesis associated RND transporter like protein HpnN
MNPEQLHPEATTFPRRCLVRLVSTVCGFPRTVLVLSLTLVVLSVVAAISCLEYHTSRDDLISSRKDYQQRWKKYLAEFGTDDDIVAVLHGKDRTQMIEALEAIAGQVREQPALFDRLFYKVDLRPLRSRALLFLSADDIRSIQRNVQGMSPLLEFGPLSWSGLSLASLLAEAQARIDRLKPGQELSADDEQFFQQLLAVTRTARTTIDSPAGYTSPWGSLITRPPEQNDYLAEPQYFFNGDGSLAFLLVRPLKEAGSFTAALKSVESMRQIVARVRPAFPELEFGLTGMPVLETDEMAAAERDTQTASWLAVAGVTLLFFLVYRSLWYPLLTVATLLTGTAWALGFATVTVGHLNILSATFAVMLIGMGDYGVLWVMRYEQARRQGADVRSALLHTTIHVAIGNLTAASTLALAFFAAILADFKAVAELGVIAGCGVLLCALACFTLLPAALTVLDRRTFAAGRSEETPWLLRFPRGSSPADTAPESGWLDGVWKRSRWVLAGGAAIVAILFCFAFRVQYDHNLLHLQAENLESVRWEMKLIENSVGTSWHALSYRATPEEALELKARYEELPGVSRVVEVAALVPADQPDKLPLLRDIQQRLRKLPERGRRILHLRPDGDRLVQTLRQLETSLHTRAAAGALLGQVHQSVEALRVCCATLPAERLGESVQHLDERLAGDLAEDLHRLRDVSNPEAITVDDMPPSLRERHVGHSGAWLLRVFARDCLWEFGPLEEFCSQVRTVDPQATGKPFGTVEGLKAMKDGLQRAGFYAFLVIAGVLLVDFGSLRRTLLALLPLVAGVIATVGIMGIVGMPLNPANMIAFPLILGVGVDNGVHVLHDYLLRRRKQRGESPISHAIGRGVLVKALTTMIGFGTLMISTERGLAGLGFILTTGVGCSMLASLVLLPAVLHQLGSQAGEVEDMQPAAEPLPRAA